LLPAAAIAGWALHPLEKCRPVTAHAESGRCSPQPVTIQFDPLGPSSVVVNLLAGSVVAPLEVEQVLLQHPDIVQAYVVGVPNRSKGEIVAAAVQLPGGAATDPAAIVAFCRERLASYKVPARPALRTAAQLPRTPTGKIHKPSLAEELAANSAT
jgi:acyl-coenzyme A synthetase/AMP-(fatty) acid ligase